MQAKIVRWSPAAPHAAVEALLRRPAFDAAAEQTARTVLDAIRAEGDAALVRYVKQYDGADIAPAQLRVTSDEIKASYEAVDLEFKQCATEAYKRIIHFSKSGMRKDWTIASPKGEILVGDVAITVADIELLYLRLQLTLSSVETARRAGWFSPTVNACHAQWERQSA